MEFRSAESFVRSRVRGLRTHAVLIALSSLLFLGACNDGDGTTEPTGDAADMGVLVGIWDIEIIANPCRTGPVILIEQRYTRCSDEDPINLSDLLPFEGFEDCSLSEGDSPYTIECSGVLVEEGCTITGAATVVFTTNASNTEATGTGTYTIDVSGTGCKEEDGCYTLDATAVRVADPPEPCDPGRLPVAVAHVP